MNVPFCTYSFQSCPKVVTSISKKWLLRLKKKMLMRKMALDWERVRKSSAGSAFPLCGKHNSWLEEFVHCGLCKRQLALGGMCTLGCSSAEEADQLNASLQADGVPSALKENAFVCKLCKTFCTLKQKSSLNPTYFSVRPAHKSYYKDYKSR